MTIFKGSHLPPRTFTGARGARKRHHGYVYSYHRVQNSYQLFRKKHDSTLMQSSIIFTCHPFQPTSISLLRVSNTFSISSPFDVTKLERLAAFHSQCQWTCIFLSLTNPMAMRTQLGFKQHRESRYSSQCSRNHGFHTMVCILQFWIMRINACK